MIDRDHRASEQPTREMRERVEVADADLGLKRRDRPAIHVHAVADRAACRPVVAADRLHACDAAACIGEREARDLLDVREVAGEVAARAARRDELHGVTALTQMLGDDAAAHRVAQAFACDPVENSHGTSSG